MHRLVIPKFDFSIKVLLWMMANVVDHATPAKRELTKGCDNGEQNCVSRGGGKCPKVQAFDFHVFGSAKEEWVGKSVISVCAISDFAIQFHHPFEVTFIVSRRLGSFIDVCFIALNDT